jgi:parvulin-like peptidyl-prolyl isomerase
VESTGDDDETTDEDWANCLAAIEEIQAQWEESDMTEDTFASMAEELSEDTGSNTNGGLYEDVYKGQMKTEFNDWCFDDSRQVGDWGVVQTDYGYHLMYFSGVGDEYWKSLADDAKRSDDYDAWYEDYSASYEAKASAFGMLFTYKDLSAD